MGGEDDLGRIVMVSSQATGVGFYWYQKVSGLVGEYRVQRVRVLHYWCNLSEIF